MTEERPINTAVRRVTHVHNMFCWPDEPDHAEVQRILCEEVFPVFAETEYRLIMPMLEAFNDSFEHEFVLLILESYMKYLYKNDILWSNSWEVFNLRDRIKDE